MFKLDWAIALPSLLLLALGLILIASSSLHMAAANGLSPWHYLEHQLLYLLVGCIACLGFARFEIFWLRRHALLIFLLMLFGLVLVLVPGIGHQVNGSYRWLRLGGFSIQVSEFMKLGVILYGADLLLRNINRVAVSYAPHLCMLAIWGVLGLLLLKEPDFGSFVVILLASGTLWFLVGCPLRYILLALFIGGFGVAAMVYFAPYRLARLTSFFHPWQHAYDSGYQLTQSLIAFGRGGLWGQGLGAGLQKQFYLPEAHTDFLYAVLCEELGMFAGLIVIVLFAIIVLRCLQLGKQAIAQGASYHGLLCYGVAIWFMVQVAINLSVNMGLLPTKGLTLPLMSYGGSSLLVSMLALSLVMKIEYELRYKPGMYLKTVANWRKKL